MEMELTDYTYPKSGTGICPQCGGKMTGVGLDWTCEGCDLLLKGPVF
jgi:tRNA(Ile2) C34 agmatinyltransferase TiaS